MPDVNSMMVVLIVFVAVLARATFGFGDALIAVPLLTLIIGIRAATPLVQLIGSTVALIVVIGSWRRIDFKPIQTLIVGALCGIPLGLIIIRLASPELVKRVLGGLLVAYGLYGLVGLKRWEPKHIGWSYLFGFLSGIFGSAYSMSGPAVMVYGTLKRWKPDEFRTTTQAVIFPSGLVVLVGHGLSGLWNTELFVRYASCLPAVIAATFLGRYANTLCDARKFVWIIYAALILLGALLIG
jgi:uncharacterized membrane protein YfcA